MAAEGKAERYCPFCDGETDAALCPNDGVATLPHSLVAGRGSAKVESGAVFAGRYRIERVLGEGGFGRVYVATQLSMGREVALKTLHAELLGDRHHVRRFYREARAASQLDSPHVVRMYDFGIDEATGTPFLAMEYLKGVPLNELMGDGISVPLERTARIIGQVAQALAEAHEAGIVHRDLKPANIFLLQARGGREFAKVMDFGIAKVLRYGDVDTGESLTASGTTVGTPRYMSPEQAMAEKVDFRSDLYALGCIMHEMLTGRQVFECEDRVSMLLKHVTVQPSPLSEVLPGGEPVPEALDLLHRSMLAKLRDQRPSHCQVVIDICDALEHGREIDAQALLIEARTGSPVDLALADTVGDPAKATLPMGPPSSLRAGVSAAVGPDPTLDPVSAGIAMSHDGAPVPSEASTRDVRGLDDPEPSTVFTPATPGEPVIPIPARPTTVPPSGEAPGVDTTDGNPSVGMGVADMAALQRAVRAPARSRLWTGAVVVLLVVGAAVGGFVLAQPDEASDVDRGAGAAPPPAVATPAALPDPKEEPAPRPAEGSVPARAEPAGAAEPAPEPVEAPAAEPIEEPAPAEPATLPAEQAAAPAPAPARVGLRSRPGGAVVKREGEELCRTPCELNLPPAEEPVKLRLTRDGYVPAEVLLTLRPGADIVRDVVLKKKRAVKRRLRAAPKPEPKPERKKLPGIRATEAPGEKAAPKKKGLPGLRMTR